MGPRRQREIKFADLFAEPANRDRLLTQRWCDALNKAREEKRGEPVGGDGMFDECPKLDEIAIVPTDKDGNGRFERLILVASPYVAGPYSEGSYEIELSVDGRLTHGCDPRPIARASRPVSRNNPGPAPPAPAARRRQPPSGEHIGSPDPDRGATAGSRR